MQQPLKVNVLITQISFGRKKNGTIVESFAKACTKINFCLSVLRLRNEKMPINSHVIDTRSTIFSFNGIYRNRNKFMTQKISQVEDEKLLRVIVARGYGIGMSMSA